MMGILDEAIREHLELKRQHGADDSELKQLEDDAFGPPQRPGTAQADADPLAEAATEFMVQPALGPDADAERATKLDHEAEQSPPRREPLADVQEPPERVEENDDEQVQESPLEAESDAPAEEEQPAAEHQTVVPPPASHSTEERHVIADLQPTELFDVEQDFASSEAPGPTDEELVAEEIVEPRLGPASCSPPRARKRTRTRWRRTSLTSSVSLEELDQALEAPYEPASEEVESPPSEEYESEEIPRVVAGEDDEEDPESEEIERPPAARSGKEDVLEETPDFLEEAPEDDELWFEQKPPKDFDFDD